MKQRKRKKFFSFRQLKRAVRALGISCQAEFLTRFKEIPGAPYPQPVTQDAIRATRSPL